MAYHGFFVPLHYKMDYYGHKEIHSTIGVCS